ncbi:vacuolar protein sorting-associated protein vps13 [Holotrichia oblita]|uniref:Vacuolar protein sorting-associated protein vps13 n=1 Tax=Holotrichia oblita TaxID=644536 RepID=A0ACB9SUC9_HOLOL|nr:vacuolar protein sorting-associated protein vps13 [Holotrichia oblita]
MLEGAVARLLNQLLGKYVVDLDTENLNVGIFSGQVQLTDLKLKPEALYELNLPIEVKAGTIGKIWLQIPWNMLWSQPVIMNIEDLHVVAAPVVTYENFDAEKNKRLLRAIKRKALSDISSKSEIIGGPNSFSEYLITNIVNNMQLNISNVHIRYEDAVSDVTPMACGICIGHISAEITNSKWKASKHINTTDTCYYLVKIEAFSLYWNPNHKLATWKLPSQYYHWRNAMSNSLQNFAINNQDFEFLIKPMTAKIKMTISRSVNGNINKVLSDIIVQDCNVQVSKEQFRSIFCTIDALKRMWISWEHLPIRPKQRILENKKIWWKYAYHACIEQRVRPYTWSRIRLVRRNYKQYTEIYKKILTNPNDTELKLDLQKYEDQLSIVNIVIARQQARLTVHENSLCEKSFWDILPSPERTILCEKIGFLQGEDNEKTTIDHNYSFRYAFDELQKFLIGCEDYLSKYTESVHKLPKNIFNFLKQKLSERWDLILDIKTPYLVIPQSASLQTGENILIVDLGRYRITTELCQDSQIAENATHMELEEQLYSRLHIECSDIQILFCDSSEDWRSGRREKDTELHVLAKNSFTASYANSTKTITAIPNQKFNINMPTLKINISERKLLIFLKFLNSIQTKKNESKVTAKKPSWPKDRVFIRWNPKYLLHVQNYITLQTFVLSRRKNDKSNTSATQKRTSTIHYLKDNLNEVWARCVDLPGLEDNISPSNTISNLIGCEIREFQLVFSKSSDSADRQYMVLRLGVLSIDIAYMTYGPAYQISLNSILLKDKLHTTPSGQYLDLVHSPVPSIGDVLTVLYRKIAELYFSGYDRNFLKNFAKFKKVLQTNMQEVPVPPGSVKFSHSARLASLHIRVCDWDYDIINVLISGLELDFLFRANERFVFRSFLANINVEHLSDVTLYSKVLYTDEDKVFEVKYVRHAIQLHNRNDISPTTNDVSGDGSFKLYIGQIHITFLYKLFIQLQRFIANLEALCYVEKMANFARKLVNQATETLKYNNKIHLAVNIKGPVLLFPQKTSSPNVIIISTGEFNIENFFKEYTSEIVENILVKANGITVSRGVMSLTSILEMQEVIVEPVNMNLDIKRFTPNSKATNRNQMWDIDGIMDIIHITLGQRDLSTILAIYSDNIGEGKLLDLLPVPMMKSPSDGAVEADETVKTLEAFFSEPKQKFMNIKLDFEGIHFVLFFDSGELLSSPIRDLNHGLCRFEINEIATSCVLFTDGSLDGKLSVDGLSIEEIGPDVNIYDKRMANMFNSDVFFSRILQSPVDDNKNNNCNITVNKPPIIDLTFHQSKANDRSIDIIIGRLSLSLSVPFTEKLAMFILDCLPKDTLDTGFINHGYVSDPVAEETAAKTRMTSLTVAVRVNRPEFIFIVETTSNKRRYFTTKSEILSDYSRHCNRLSLVISLSGLHSLFYDVGLHSMEPYTILKQCDIELSRTYTEEKGEKVTASVSSIYIQLLPDGDVSPTRYKRNDMMTKSPEDLWEPKRLKEYICKDEYAEVKNAPPPAVHEIFLLPKTEVMVVLELKRFQLL